jgi:uracil-DNA glycosylase family 4
MKQEELGHLIREYGNLWKDLGVEELERKVKAPALAKILSRNLAGERKKVAAAPEVVPRNIPKFKTLEDIRGWIGDCRRCQLCQGRSNIVFGSGNPTTKLLFVGEAPGADEDQAGMPFVGRAGQLLTKIIEAMGHARSDFYIANIIKCRPPNNRAPEPPEIEQCMPFLKAQIDVIQPDMIVALGSYSAKTLTGSEVAISNLRGRFHPLVWNPKVAVMPTYHPAYLLRNPAAKKMVWDDIKLVKARLESLH